MFKKLLQVDFLFCPFESVRSGFIHSHVVAKPRGSKTLQIRSHLVSNLYSDAGTYSSEKSHSNFEHGQASTSQNCCLNTFSNPSRSDRFTARTGGSSATGRAEDHEGGREFRPRSAAVHSARATRKCTAELKVSGSPEFSAYGLKGLYDIPHRTATLFPATRVRVGPGTADTVRCDINIDLVGSQRQKHLQKRH